MDAFPFASHLLAAIFVAAVMTTVAGALVAVLTTRLIRAVAALMICCVGLAGLYYFLHSPFLALMEILIYVGAVCVTIVFAVMLAEPDEPADTGGSRSRSLWGILAGIASALIAIAVARVSLQAPWPVAPVERLSDGSVAAIGKALLTTYSLAFELISLVLLVAILGALVIARAGRRKPQPADVGIVAAGVIPPLQPPAAPSPPPPAATPEPVASTHR
jgi:NADH:ubiquinone oxidoreductase subunit 6 (subunit J)